MSSTLGAPSRARTGAGHAGADSSAVLPITPGNAAPGSYSSIAIRISPASRHYPPLSPYPAVRWQSLHHPARVTRVKGFHTASTFSPCCLHMPAAGLGYDPGRDGEYMLIALDVDLVAVLAPDDLRKAADRGCA